MRRAHSTADGIRPPSAFVPVALAIAIVTMTALHVVQTELDPFDEPVSFYVHGEMGWLLTVALGSFGLAALGLSRSREDSRVRSSLAWFGITMLLTAAVPSDRWFPWEMTPTVHGIVHATAAIIGPPLLLVPMLAAASRNQDPAFVVNRWLAIAYAAAMVSSAASLLMGFLLDRAPPLIGITERLLALAALIWMALATAQARGRRLSPGYK